MTKPISCTFFLFALCWAGAGCGGGGKEEATFDVTGTVTLNGTALADGDITFESEKPDGLPPGSASIKNGAYSLKVRPGTKIVKITAERVVPGKKGPMDTEVKESIIPAKYNVDSKEKVEIKEGANSFDFKLTK